MTPSQIADPLIGRLVDGRYRVRARIARGGMATVYVATDLRLERRIALKVMHGHLSDDSVFQSRFIQEARAAARLADPNVVNVFDQGQDGELAYLVMEYLPGITLRELLKEQRRLSVSQAVTIMDAILSGLAAAHRAGIVHRDVKPENVLLAEDGRIKIGDFGLARATTANTATGQQLMGTIAYLAPELVTRGTADARSDIYALGIMLYEMLTGEQPYRGEQPMQIAFQHATESVPRPSVRNPGVPEALDELVLWSTEREPDARPVDAQAMLDRLREIERELGITPVVTRREAPVTSGLAIPEDAHTTAGITTVMPLETDPVGSVTGVTGTAPQDTTDNATRLRTAGRRGRSRGLWLILAALILALLAGFGGWWFGAGPGSKIGIPDFSGGAPASAVEQLTALGLQPTEANEASLDVDPGAVTRTDPAAGERVDKGADVTVYVSTGPAEAVLPTFVGVSEADARTLLESQSMDLPDPVYEFTDQVSADTVIALSITPRGGGDAVTCTEGCTVHQGDTANLTVSKGDLPAVKGKRAADARAAFEAVGLQVSADMPKVFTPDFPADTVSGVGNPGRPEGNWRVGDETVFWLSAGPLPDVAGKTAEEARDALTKAGLTVAEAPAESYSDTVEEGRVIGLADREGGGAFRPGDTVTLNVSLGPELFEVPSVEGMTIREAMQTLTDHGFAPTTAIPEIFWDIPAVRTDPGAGEMARKGSSIRVIALL